MTEDVFDVTLRVYKLPGDGEMPGGFVLAELVSNGDGMMSQVMRSARGDLDQILGSIGRIVRAWDVETTKLVKAQAEDGLPAMPQKKNKRLSPSLPGL